ncbi:MAG: YlxR family protein [Clostridia bacterium]|nr:YlxR family protein [Clostridia bacterium]
MPEKHIPLRMCIVTRKMLPKQQLIRLVKTESGLLIDKSQKMSGRGFWISKDAEVVALARKKRALNRVAHCEVKDDLYNDLETYVNE